MNFKKNEVYRFLIIIFGIILIIFGGFSFYNQSIPLIDSLVNSLVNVDMSSSGLNFNINFNLVSKESILNSLIILFIGFFVLEIGYRWSNIFKVLTKWLVSFGILFFTISIFLFILNDNSDNLVNSIQPSIDLIVSYEIDSMYNNYVKDKNYNLDVLASDNINIIRVCNKNLTLAQANLIISNLDLEDMNDEYKIFFSKVLITQISNQIKQNFNGTSNFNVPLSQIKLVFDSLGIDLNVIKMLSISDLKSFVTYDENSTINILISNNSKILNLKVNHLSKNQVDLIWKNLDLNGNLSENSKEKLLNLGIVFLKSQNSSILNSINNLPLPIASVSGLIPKDMKQVLNYDLLNDNISIRKNNLVLLRSDCLNNKIKFDKICNLVEKTYYDNFMFYLKNESKNQNSSSINFVNMSLILNDYGSLDKIKKSIDYRTSGWINYFMYFIICFIFAIIFYYLHFKLFKRELILVHIPYYISKLNLINFFTPFLFFTMFYYILKTKIFLDFIPRYFEYLNQITFMTTLPIFNILVEISKQVFNFSLYYFIFSILLFVGLYFYLKIEIGRRDKESNDKEDWNNKNVNERNDDKDEDGEEKTNLEDWIGGSNIEEKKSKRR